MSDYTAEIGELLTKYKTASPEEGLTSGSAAQQLEAYGENIIRGRKPRSFLQRFLSQMKDVMIIILMIAAVVSLIISFTGPDSGKDFIDVIVILIVIIVNGILGARQESQAEKALEALKNASAPVAKVVRDGEAAILPASQIVPGDVVILEAGDMVPADGRILESASLMCEESSLTGESVPVGKDASANVEEDAPLGDRRNMVYSGCTATYGRGRVLVTATGMNSEIGKIAGLLDSEKPELTPLQHKLNGLGRYLGIITISISAIIFVVGVLRGAPVMETLMMVIALAVAAVPEGLAMIVTVALALGVRRMVKQNAIIRRLPAVETLGSASVICSDKTGTLTQNRMTVQYVWPAGHDMESMSGELSGEAAQVVKLGAMCNDGMVTAENGESRHIGDPTETAIIAAALQCGMDKTALNMEFPRVAELPFDSGRKLMTTVHRVGEKLLAVTKGGYDVLLPLCTSGPRSRAPEANKAMGKNGLRVLAVACRELDSLPEEVTTESLENDLIFVGLIGMSDPLREESAVAVQTAKAAGIRTIMITGDHIETARAISKQLGLFSHGQTSISGVELNLLSDEELANNIERYSVYARVTPEDKLRIVKAWQANGQVVAVTGDGVNDAPALKAADIGCAMGITGTDVAKGAADMILTDDNFATIIEAVKEGRGIYSNIRKTIQFLLCTNLGAVFVVFLAIMLGWGAPLLAIHLLMINLITDAFPALALGVEPVRGGVMKDKPIPKSRGVFAGGLGLLILFQGLMVGVLGLTAYYIGQFVQISEAFGPSHSTGMTMTFLVLALSKLVHALNCRSRKSIFKIGLLSNPAMLKALGVSLSIVFAICLIPPLEPVFRMTNLSWGHWGIVAGLSLTPLFVMEIVKLVNNRRQEA